MSDLVAGDEDLVFTTPLDPDWCVVKPHDDDLVAIVQNPPRVLDEILQKSWIILDQQPQRPVHGAP